MAKKMHGVPFHPRKSNNFRYRDSYKSDNYIKSNKEKILNTKMNQRRLSAVSLKGAIEKSPILLYLINNWIAPS